MAKDFQVVFQELMLGELGELERQRKAFARSFRTILWIFILLLGGWTAFFLLEVADMNEGWMLFVPLAVILIVGGVWLGIKYSNFHGPYKQAFKAKVIPALVKCVDDRLEYNPQRGLISEYTASKLFMRSYDRHKSEDTITATFEKTRFSFGEVFTEYKTTSTDSKGNRRETWHTIFRGLLFVGDFNKNFMGETIIDQDNMERIFGKLGRKFQQWNGDRAGDLIRLENPEFEKRFAIYSTDEQECRYILTPSLMERILKINERSGRKICMSFLNNKVYLAYSINEDLFEPSVFRQTLKEQDAEFLTKVIDMMSDIVEDLNLNTRIWTKA